MNTYGNCPWCAGFRYRDKVCALGRHGGVIYKYNMLALRNIITILYICVYTSQRTEEKKKSESEVRRPQRQSYRWLLRWRRRRRRQRQLVHGSSLSRWRRFQRNSTRWTVQKAKAPVAAAAWRPIGIGHGEGNQWEPMAGTRSPGISRTIYRLCLATALQTVFVVVAITDSITRYWNIIYTVTTTRPCAITIIPTHVRRIYFIVYDNNISNYNNTNG